MGFLLINISQTNLLSRVLSLILPEKLYFYIKKQKMKSTITSKEIAKINPQNTIEITTVGSLGLLALGAVGIKAWREKRKEEKERLNAQSEKING